MDNLKVTRIETVVVEPPAGQVFRRTEIVAAEDGRAVEQHTYARSLNLPAGIYEAELARYTLVPVEEYAAWRGAQDEAARVDGINR